MAPQHLHGQGLEHVISCFSESASEREMGISVIYFNNFQYSKAVEQRRVDPVVRTGPKSVLTLSRMVLGELKSGSIRRKIANFQMPR